MLTVANLYRFAPVADPAALRGPVSALCAEEGLRGTLLIAPEGINGTVAGPGAGIARLLDHLRGLPGFADLQVRLDTADDPPFGRMKVRIKREIVTLGRPEADPTRQVGTYVDPADWNALIAAPEVAVIDTRNAYEVAIGSFAGAIDPGLAAFRDFPAWWEAQRDRLAGRPVAMFCTGGIRCEKATSLLRAQGVTEVHHLRGGILAYLEQVPEIDSLWRGECFVFDERVALGHGLAPGTHDLCRACRRPVSRRDRRSPLWEPGVACPACAAERSDRARFHERERQVALAAARGRAHLGPSAQL